MRGVRLVGARRPLVAFEEAGREAGPGEVTVEVHACGICHSDAHYRGGLGGVALPLTPGHEVAGIVANTGPGVTEWRAGDRVAVHYLVSCGTCERCRESGEQFCTTGQMIGKDRDGGYAEGITVPARNLVRVPDAVPLDVAAVMMCSTATVYHALRLADMRRGAAVLLLGFGGLGFSALEVSRALGAERVTVVDVVPEKLALAERMGAEAIDASAENFAETLRTRGYDIALDFVGRPNVSTAALRALKPGGRLGIVALSETPMDFNPYRDLLARERRIIGCSDHLREELVELLAMAERGEIHIEQAISRRVPLDADAINGVLDELDRGTAHLRTVIVK